MNSEGRIRREEREEGRERERKETKPATPCLAKFSSMGPATEESRAENTTRHDEKGVFSVVTSQGQICNIRLNYTIKKSVFLNNPTKLILYVCYCRDKPAYLQLWEEEGY